MPVSKPIPRPEAIAEVRRFLGCTDRRCTFHVELAEEIFDFVERWTKASAAGQGGEVKPEIPEDVYG